MKIFQSIFFTLGILIIVFFVGLSLIKIYPNKVTVDNEVNNLEQKIAEVESYNSKLGSMLDYFKSDSYLEREARERLNYKKPDEQAVFIFREKDGPVLLEESIENLSYPQRWWKWIWQ